MRTVGGWWVFGKNKVNLGSPTRTVCSSAGPGGDGAAVQRAAAGVEGGVGFGPHVAADLVGEDVAGAFVAVASDFGGFAAALNLKTTVEPRIDRMDPDAKPTGAANDYP
jgi:hypothetical protein